MGLRGKKPEKIFPRNCFACGNPMSVMKDTLVEGTPPWLECQGCDVKENATVNGLFPNIADELEWDGEFVPLVDHSKIYLPSPDMIGTC